MMRIARHSARARRGTVLIVAMVLIFVLAGMTLALCRSMRTEAIASANYAASLQASLVERGAEQYLLSMLSELSGDLSQSMETDFAAIQVGDGYFWVLRPDYGDPALPVFGLVDEAAKLNINTATFDQLMCLPYMTDDVAAAIVDWRSDPNKSTPGGAQSEYYLSLEDAYYCKNDLYETVEELLLVRGVTQELLYGNGQATPLGEASSITSTGSSSVTSDLWLRRGLYDLLTAYSIEPAGSTATGSAGGGRQTNTGGAANVAPATPQRGRINVNTAPREVLLTLPGLEPAEVDRIISQRASATSTTSNSTNWLSGIIGQKVVALQNLITGRSYQYSADILAVSGNGRAFKRVRIVIDMTTGTPQIIYRRDNTDRGWPMDLDLLESLRAGQGPGAWSGMVNSTSGGLTR